MIRRWGALLAAVTAIFVLGAAASPAQAEPARDDGNTETVYLVKGYNPKWPAPAPCTAPFVGRWDDLIDAMPEWGWEEEQFVTVGFYKGEVGCDVNLAPKDGDPNLSLRELGRRLAWGIYNLHSSKGESVDLVGHSMGGLIVRAAILGVTHHAPEEKWPPFIRVEDAVTLGTPHYGTQQNCEELTLQCQQMKPGSSFLTWLHSTGVPQPTRTDWTFIGSNADKTVNKESATPTNDGAQHLVRYAGDERITHGQLRYLTGCCHRMYYRNKGSLRWTQKYGPAPVPVVSNALYWASRW
ncbi:hypothetical protein QFZ55_000049 [Streptomyces luteogriseus]|uniref:esterase/lipase family protein n=1 Tax=Streptomyces luteogriseus TaxID=68233 RepID=UPI00277FA50B|nr:hypothetical protein [Streptomyces luteogriseus]MDQ0710597.1 hypothetical protein [Streptomyces luteogriseus]